MALREGTYPPAPLFASLIVGYACAYEERGMASGFARDLRERVFGFYGVIHSVKAIKTARETNYQKAMRSPFLAEKGAGWIGPSLNAIKTAMDTNHQKAMRSPFLAEKGPGDRSLRAKFLCGVHLLPIPFHMHLPGIPALVLLKSL